MRKILGATLIAIPLITMTVFMVIDLGWLVAAAIWFGVASVAAIFAAGIVLLLD